MAEIPTQALEAAARELASRVKPDNHSQLCPVWVKKRPVEECNCWILKQARRDAAIVAPYLITEGRRQAAAAIRADAADVKTRAAAQAGGVAPAAAEDHPFSVGVEWAARIAENPETTHG
jgi:hypothetical protein